MFSNSSSQANVLMLNNIVLEALVGSVQWTLPWVRFQINQESTVPKAICPACAADLSAGIFLSNQLILDAEK